MNGLSNKKTPMGMAPDGFGIIEVKESQEMETPND